MTMPWLAIREHRPWKDAALAGHRGIDVTTEAAVRKALAVGVEVTIWWAIGLGVWLLTLSSVDGPDLIVATPLTLGGGVLAVMARRVLGGDWPYPHRASAWAGRLPIAIGYDTVRILARPWVVLLSRRPDEGHFVRIPVAPGPDARSTTRRAAAVFLVSLTPGSYAVHADDDTGELVVHCMGGSPRWSMDEVVRR